MSCGAEHRLGDFRQRFNHWAGVAVLHDPVSKARYASLRTRGLRHSRSLRTVGDRLLYVACTLLKKGEMFDKNFKKPLKEAA